MNFYFSQFNHEPVICRVEKGDHHDDGLNHLFFSDDEAILFPERYHFPISPTEKERCVLLQSGDVLKIEENGIAYRNYSVEEGDFGLFLTGRCNSCCVMCPSSNNSRQFGCDTPVEELIEILKYIPYDTQHITITGGEPFMIREKVFTLLDVIKQKLPRTETLLLTNGRILANSEYAENFKRIAPYYTQVGIPIHGSTAELHDHITQVKGSFEQTITGIMRLAGSNIRIEVRIVVSKLNAHDITNIATFIIKKIPHVACVNFIALEMTGSAATNADQVWLSYNEAFNESKAAINYLVQHGIDVALYNFPLCMVEPAYRQIAAKSISAYKITYAKQCDNCRLRNECGGVFAGTIRYLKDSMRPV